MFHFISAGAGAGKTTFIINKIKNLLMEKPSIKVLIITYTNSCVDEIKKRMEDERIYICTFHALCHQFVVSDKIFTEQNNLQILAADINLNISPEFENFYNYLLCHSPLSIPLYKQELREIFPGEAYEKPLNNLKDFFREDGILRTLPPPQVINKEEWWETLPLIKGHFNSLNLKYNLLYMKYFEDIENVRKKINLYTFHHMILEILQNIDAFLMHIWGTYDHIFIDEVQDLSHIQFEIIEQLSHELVFLENKSITIVGDVNQSIFSFQGANKSNFNKFIQNIKSIPHLLFKEEVLKETYRFGGEILEFINKNFHLHTSQKTEGSLKLHPLSINRQDLFKQIAIEIKKVPKEESILILFQKRSSLTSLLEEYLEENYHIKIQIHKKIFYQHKLIGDFFSLIAFIMTKQDIYLVEFLTSGMCHIEEPEFFTFCKGLKAPLWKEVLKVYGHKKEMVVLEKLYEVIYLEDFLEIFCPSILCENFYNYYGKDAYIFVIELQKISHKDTYLYHLLNLQNQDLWFQQEGQVIFSTVHNAKGGEADHVFIIDGNEGKTNGSLFLKKNFPIYNFFKTNKNNGNEEEFHNLLYVSMTRAKKSLNVFAIGKKINPQSIYGMIDKFKKQK